MQEGRSRVRAAALEAERAISTAESRALGQTGSWTTDYQAQLRDMHDVGLDTHVLGTPISVATHVIRISSLTTCTSGTELPPGQHMPLRTRWFRMRRAFRR